MKISLRGECSRKEIEGKMLKHDVEGFKKWGWGRGGVDWNEVKD